MQNKLLGLDVGERRIGVSIGDDRVKIASPLITINVDGKEIDIIKQLIADHGVSTMVVGYPRNQSGDTTKQTRLVELFADKLRGLGPKLVFSDESVTSVLAEQRLVGYNKPYTKADIDAQAATIILQDYLNESH